MKNIYAAFFRRLFRTLFVLGWLAATPLLATPCTDTIYAPLGSDLRTYEIAAGDAALFEVDAPAAGLLVVEASTPAGTDAEPRLALFGEDCRPATPDGVRVVARWISAMVVEVDAPGVYRFAVAAQDPREPLAEVAFTTRFADVSTLCGGAVLKTMAEPEPDPDMLAFCAEKTMAEPEPDPDMLRAGLDTLCPHTWGDRHGDVLACATPIVPGKPVSGGLGWDDDVDVFTFTVATQGTVVVGTEGDATIHGALYDSSGHRLAVDGDDDGLRLVRTLAPGRYYVRVGGTGDYALTVAAESW